MNEKSNGLLPRTRSVSSNALMESGPNLKMSQCLRVHKKSGLHTVCIPLMSNHSIFQRCAADYESVALPTELSWLTVETPTMQGFSDRQELFKHGQKRPRGMHAAYRIYGHLRIRAKFRKRVCIPFAYRRKMFGTGNARWRPLHSQCRGQEFDPPHLHQK